MVINMNNDRFLLEFCAGNDVIETNKYYQDYLAALNSGVVFDEIVTASKLMAHQKLDVNAYITVNGGK